MDLSSQMPVTAAPGDQYPFLASEGISLKKSQNPFASVCEHHDALFYLCVIRDRQAPGRPGATAPFLSACG